MFPGSVLAAVLLVATAGAETIRLNADEAAARAAAIGHPGAIAAAQARAAQAGLAAADAARTPLLTATASAARRSSVPELALTLPGTSARTVLAPSIENAYASGLRLEQLLWSGGALSGARDAARAELEASRAGLDRVASELRLTGRAAYWNAVRASSSREAVRAEEQRSRRLLADTEALADVGMAVRADLLAARERVASAGVRAVRAEAAVADAFAALRSLLAISPDDSLELADTAMAPLPAPPPDSRELRRLARDARAEIAALAARIEAAGARVIVAEAGRKPSLAATAEWQLARPNQRIFPLEDEWNDSWSVGIAGSWRLFDGGRARADAATARARQDALAAERDELVRQVDLEVDSAALALSSALAEVGAAEAAAATAAERHLAARDRHEAGLAAMAEILDAEAALAAAEQALVDARTGAFLGAARLERALGR